MSNICTMRPVQNSDTLAEGVFTVISKIFDPFTLNKMMTTTEIIRIEGNPHLRSYDANDQKNPALYVHQLKGSVFII